VLVKEGDYETALQLFLRAESEGFTKCSSDLLEMMDNYGLLCLDIAWTYFKLKDPAYLKEAGWRLKKAQECLEKTYGPNMERLKRLKGGAPEIILFARLNLLSAVAAFHNQNSVDARRFLNEAEQKLNSLKISDEELASLVAMGFSSSESCVALRACEKNQDAAVAYLIIKKESQRQLHEQERQQRAEKRERRRAGKTANGEWVNIALLKMLTGMGFNRKLATEALRQTNNDDALAIGLLTNSDNVLEASLRASKSKKSQGIRLLSSSSRKDYTGCGNGVF